ncbi:hypothetical protein [Commensalibacter oyaizuii]|uniref:DUF1311 domain-containing protein n=1 Tax=Commensalibacter oyaizuii TaxID=3043873 RepID=A0ABT6Q3W5_9PROT|nr:hypothetical protein [Commensalibacter sp. TBRC 16381]MDI2091820.1 hypothetical protein [Commensalibacter sp. TBRC 16381]
MKKIVLALSLVIVPLTAKAQTEVSDEIIQNAAEELKPALCNNDLRKAIGITQDCYKASRHAEIDKINQCVLEDFMTSGLVKMKRTKAEKNGETDPYSDIEFVNPDNVKLRLIKYRNSYSYDNKASEIMRKKLYNDTMRVALVLHKGGCFNPNEIH